MENIPTAEQFLRMQGCREGDGEWDLVRTSDLILFTEMHIKAASKEAIDKYVQFYEGSVEDAELDKMRSLIINSYSLENIK